MKKLKPNEDAYWRKYLETLSATNSQGDFFVEAGYCGNREITDELLALYLAGKKTAGSGLVKDYQSAGDPLPKVGNHWIILDSKDNPRCIVRTLRIEVHKFKEIPLAVAIAEGEGDCSVEYWQRVHGNLYRPYLAKWGI